MKSIANMRGAAVVALLASLLLRASIPDGYMPAKWGSGLLVELCPARVPAQVMQALGGDHHHHGPASTSSHLDTSQCPIGHMLSAAAAVDDFWIIEGIKTGDVFSGVPVLPLQTRSLRSHRSRGPPA